MTSPHDSPHDLDSVRELEMTGHPVRPLTLDEERVLSFINDAGDRAVGVPELSAALRLSPDEVVKATGVLLARHLIEVSEPEGTPTPKLEVVGAGR